MMDVLAWPAYANKTGNPYTRLLYDAMQAEGVCVHEWTPRAALHGGHDLWHVHWPDDFLSYSPAPTAVAYVAAELALIAQARQRGARIVWTIHDLGPHESPHPWLEGLFWPLFLPMVDGIVTLSDHALQAARRRFPQLQSVPSAVVPHGHYRPAYPDPISRTEARRALDLSLDARVIAYIGRIRPYKNVEGLVRAFREVDDAHARLVIAGNPASDALAARIRSVASKDDRIQLDLRFVPDKEIPVLLGAANLVSLPYEDILHSGSALLALSFDRPTLVPNAGAMAELQDDVGDEWVYTYDGNLTPDVLAGALEAACTVSRPPRAPLDHRAWDILARQTIDLYERVLMA